VARKVFFLHPHVSINYYYYLQVLFYRLNFWRSFHTKSVTGHREEPLRIALSSSSQTRCHSC